jgi:hypothetical protein
MRAKFWRRGGEDRLDEAETEVASLSLLSRDLKENNKKILTQNGLGLGLGILL